MRLIPFKEIAQKLSIKYHLPKNHIRDIEYAENDFNYTFLLVGKKYDEQKVIFHINNYCI